MNRPHVAHARAAEAASGAGLIGYGGLKIGADGGPVNAEFSALRGAGFAQHRLCHLRGDREMEGLVR
jgi:hypothetical protein